MRALSEDVCRRCHSLKLKLEKTWMKDDLQIALSEYPVEIEVSDL